MSISSALQARPQHLQVQFGFIYVWSQVLICVFSEILALFLHYL